MTTLDNPGATYGMCQAVTDAVNERARQDAKWGYEFPGRPHSHWLAILTEEVGEAAQAVCKTEIPPEDGEWDLSDLRREVVQIAAVALSWLEHGGWPDDEPGPEPPSVGNIIGYRGTGRG